MKLLAALLVCLVAACGGEAPETFILMQSDVADFRTWSRFEVGTGDSNGTHPAGTRVVYVNQIPDSSDKTFPVGTILVKLAEENGKPVGDIHVMSKRGGDFNTGGALGWEFLELELSDSGVPVIMWRGRAPPAGEEYGGDGIERADCNVCHMEAAANDSVKSPKLKLGSF